MSKKSKDASFLEIVEFVTLFFGGSALLWFSLCYIADTAIDWSNAAWRKLNEETRIEIVNNIPKANCLEADVVYHVYRGPNSSNGDVDDVVLASGGRE